VIQAGFNESSTQRCVLLDFLVGIFEITQIGFMCQYFRIRSVSWQHFSLVPFQLFLVAVKTVSMVLFYRKVRCVTGAEKGNYIGGAEACGV
jgi:hypothetical protein